MAFGGNRSIFYKWRAHKANKNMDFNIHKLPGCLQENWGDATGVTGRWRCATGVSAWRAEKGRARVTASGPAGRPSPAWCQSPFSHSWPSAAPPLPLWSPRWSAPSCRWSPSCRRTCGQDGWEEEQEDWDQSGTDWKWRPSHRDRGGDNRVSVSGFTVQI